MVSSVGHSCGGAADLVAQYMTYSLGDRCPEDASLAEKLLSRGCEPLPRRRCLSRRTAAAAGAFDRQMWVKPRGKNDFLIDDVLSLTRGIRIGFDIAGGAGNFAARMAERNVTVGLFPLFLTPGQRFPFSDSVFDLVHTGNALDGASAAVSPSPEKMEFFMFDVDRVVRPGGLIWLDNFRCPDEKMKSALTVLIDKFGFKKLKWVVGEKLGPSGAGKSVLLSAVLQKPARS
ncbi:unnamed protein product [Spirodela intermedia]|uniref:Uncharacterized protein n=1 Tax=Spirodela intermedia TaxID=51605 RepID=A0A7I8IZF7_SPIIN|nr:unnamed protein product [Spirodela intermedia]CAA6663189.1 unnamed protein product [Spirodela intermedia]